MQTELPDRHGRSMPLVPNPMRFDGQRALAEQAPPEIDQHGDAIRAGQAWKPR
jgi:crotonobetainyl-CoA:carnitine CoA-transferase CaiB-like acyl-CoA transferase